MPKLYSMIVGHAEKHLSAQADGSVLYVTGIALLMVLTALLMMAGGIGGAYFGAKAAVNFASDLRLDVYKRVQDFSFANIDKFQTGSLITRLTNDVTQLQNFVNMLLRMFLRAPGMLIGALIMCISLSPKLALVLAAAWAFRKGRGTAWEPLFWLGEYTGCMSVWQTRVVAPTVPTEQQQAALEELHDAAFLAPKYLMQTPGQEYVESVHQAKEELGGR